MTEKKTVTEYYERIQHLCMQLNDTISRLIDADVRFKLLNSMTTKYHQCCQNLMNNIIQTSLNHALQQLLNIEIWKSNNAVITVKHANSSNVEVNFARNSESVRERGRDRNHSNQYQGLHPRRQRS